jgi:magnesium transporter
VADIAVSDLVASRKSLGMFDKLALGRAVVGGGAAPIPSANTTPSDGKGNLSAIHEGEVLKPKHVRNPSTGFDLRVNHDNPGQENNVTYRERLGGFLHPRDMRRLVTPFSASNEPEIIVRRHAILLNFDPLRAIILRDRLLVVVPDGADSILVELERRLRGGLEYERDTEYSGVDDDTNTPGGSTRSLVKDNNCDVVESIADGTDSTVDLSKGELPEGLGLDDNQGFFDAFVENEWDELEGREWVDLPFELQALDSVLASVSSILAEDVLELQFDANTIIQILVEPVSNVDDHADEILRQMKNSVQEMKSRVDGFCRAVDLVLEDYEDMALMNLSRLITHPDKFIQPVSQAVLDEESDEPELILEAHLQRGHTLKNALLLVQGQITSTEDFADRKTDMVRNRLLYINLVLQTMSLAVAFGSFVGSIFGMNVLNRYEESTNAFYIIILAALAFMGFLVFFVIFMIRRLGALPRNI